MKLKLLLVLSIIVISLTGYSQAICGFDAIMQKRSREDPSFKSRLIDNNRNIRSYIQRNKSRLSARITGGSYTIPVVVHVIHTGGPVGSIYNPSDAQIKGAIDYLNQVYNGTYPGTGGAGNLGIQFVLAKRDPHCNATDGIDRVDGSGIPGYSATGVSSYYGINPGIDELNIKNYYRWDSTRYYNIWVVNKIDGRDGTSGQFVAGFAYFPLPGNEPYDGTVMLATQMVAGQKTLPHEIGHAFNLYHPFEGSDDMYHCPVNNDCNLDGDEVCDTDPISKNMDTTGVVDFAPRTGINPCTGTAYSSNTESNYMNYTNSYTLFTINQRDRMQATVSSNPMRVGLTNSDGGTDPGAGTTTCTPKVNFEFTGDQKSEGSSTGCKSSYTDYNYNLLIGSSPSATTKATLNVVSGTALEGVDFDITTNGSFTTPSKVVTFATGSNAAQSFTVRVYNDAAIEGTESFTLGFTVDNGGGNAVAGDGRPNFTFKILDNNITPVAVTTTTGNATVGNPTLLMIHPFDTSAQKAKYQILYKASELTAAGIPAGYITGLSIYLQKNSTRPFGSVSIKMGTTGVNYLVDNGSAYVGNPLVVKTVNNYSTVNGWNSFAFDTPFNWDGTSNVIVEICYDKGSSGIPDAADYTYSYKDGGTVAQGNFIFQSGINCADNFYSINYYQEGIKPIINFGYGVPGTIVQTSLNASKSEYLGPYSDVYFYDQASNKLLARVKNLSGFDYGCTQVVIDRAGTSASPFWNNNTSNYLLDKTFHIIPTTNNPAGQNQVTFYYSADEKTGWESATGQSWNDIQLVKVPSQISNYSPSSPAYDGSGAVKMVTPTLSTLGSQYALTYTFDNGFSGFGAGVPGATITLPVTLINFDGRLVSKSALLNWSTSSEMSTKSFDIEKSKDGTSFTRIGTVPATGNSKIKQDYSFRDDQLNEDNYYRLRTVDENGHSSLSDVVLVRYMNTAQNVSVINNPIDTYIDLRFSRLTNQAVLQLLGSDGSMVLKKQVSVNANTLRWNLPANLSKGIYIVKVITENQVFTSKVIKN